MHDLGYSRDQFYRRVRLLSEAGLIHPDRGKHNELLLSSRDRLVLQSFRDIEQKSAKHSLEWCLERLRAEILEKRLEAVTDQANYLQAENTALRKALVTYRRWSLKRLFRNLKARLFPSPPKGN